MGERVMIKVAICDDNIEVLKQLKSIIEEKEPQWQVDLFQNGFILEEQLQKNLYALYFLDIELGDMNGYCLSKKVRKKDASALIIFVSSHSEYACEAFEVDAFRFLKKPIVEEKVLEAVEKAKEILQTQNYHFHYHYKGNGMDYQVKLANILYFERNQRIVKIHFFNGETADIYASIKEVEKQLKDKNFSRCHQGILVNFDYIKVLQDSVVVLENGEKLPISRKRKEVFGEEYMNYCWNREEDVEV